MSSVAQNRDIYDPEVVADFAREVKSQMRLDYLYALTVADINATNPTLWNGWRATLMRHLYAETRRFFQTREEPLDRQESIQAFQESALDQLESDLPDLKVPDLQQIWQDLGDDFFLRHTTPEIVSLSKKLLEHGDNAAAFVSLSAPQTAASDEGATKIYVLDQDRPKTFASLVVTLSQLGLTIVDAYISKASHDRYFDMFTVLDEDGTEASDPALRQSIVDHVKATLENPEPSTNGATQRVSRQLKELKMPASVSLAAQEDGLTAVLNVTASDRPGLLANIALVLVELGLEITSARITTLGERVEDVFLVTRVDGASINDAQQCYDIEQAIRQRLDQTL
jgi:[protein-PII] uridylyltransferase